MVDKMFTFALLLILGAYHASAAVLGEPCTENTDCFGTVSSTCSTGSTKQCICTTGYFEVQGKCAKMEYACHKDDQNGHNIQILYYPGDTNNDPFEKLYVVGHSSTNPGNAAYNCFDNDVSVNSSGQKFILHVRAGTSAATQDCGIQNNNNIVNVPVYLVRSAKIIQGSDYSFNIPCDFTGDRSQNVVLNAPIAVSGEIAKRTPESLLENVQLHLTDINNNVQTSCSLEDKQKVHLRIDLQQSNSAHGVRAIYCEAKPTANETTMSMIIELLKNRCNNPDSDVKLDAGGFKQIPASTGTFSIQSPQFGCFKFNTNKEVYFQCAVSFCTEANDPACSEDQCDNPPNPNNDPVEFGRRRRAANKGSVVVVPVQVALKISVYGETTVTTTAENIPTEFKVNMLDIMIGVGGCGLLLVILICIIIIYLVKLRIAKRTVKHQDSQTEKA